MAHIIGQRRTRQASLGNRMGFSEIVISLAIVGALVFGVYYYFAVYMKSPGYALKSFLGEVAAGRDTEQYDMLDRADKSYWPTKKKYEDDTQFPLAQGYTERITNVEVSSPTPDPKNPDIVSIKATMDVTSNMAHEKLYQASSTHTVTDTFIMRKDQDGVWKVWITASPPRNLLQITPNPPGSNF